MLRGIRDHVNRWVNSEGEHGVHPPGFLVRIMESTAPYSKGQGGGVSESVGRHDGVRIRFSDSYLYYEYDVDTSGETPQEMQDMNGNNGNGQTAERYFVFTGCYGREYASLEGVRARLEELREQNRTKGCPWRAVRVHRRNGYTEMTLEGGYFDVAYEPRQWRC